MELFWTGAQGCSLTHLLLSIFFSSTEREDQIPFSLKRNTFVLNDLRSPFDKVARRGLLQFFLYGVALRSAFLLKGKDHLRVRLKAILLQQSPSMRLLPSVRFCSFSCCDPPFTTYIISLSLPLAGSPLPPLLFSIFENSLSPISATVNRFPRKGNRLGFDRSHACVTVEFRRNRPAQVAAPFV